MKPYKLTTKFSPGSQEVCSHLLASIKKRIRNAQYEALKAVNREFVGLYWDIGQMIVEKQPAEGWGKAVVKQLAADLRLALAGVAGFSTSNLWRMKAMFEAFANLENTRTNGASNRLEPQLGHCRAQGLV